MVRLHLNSQTDYLWHQLCQQRTSLEDKLKYWMSAKSEESTIIQLNMMRIAHRRAFWTAKIGFTGIASWGIWITAKTIERQMLNLIWIMTMASSIRNAQSSGMWGLHQMFPDRFGQHGTRTDTLKRWRWRSMQWKWGWTQESRESRTECVKVSPASLCSLTESFS